MIFAFISSGATHREDREDGAFVPGALPTFYGECCLAESEDVGDLIPWAPKTMKNRGFGHLKTRFLLYKPLNMLVFGDLIDIYPSLPVIPPEVFTVFGWYVLLGSSHTSSRSVFGSLGSRWWFLNIFFDMFTSKIGEDEPNLTIHIFQTGWFNHQLDIDWDVRGT